MLRGRQSIFQSLFEPLPVASTTLGGQPERKGRNEDLIEKRNDLLIARHYYYAVMCRRQYQDILESLTQELFLTERTIINVIQNNHDKLRQLRDSKPDLSHFRSRFPFMKWSLTPTLPAREGVANAHSL